MFKLIPSLFRFPVRPTMAVLGTVLLLILLSLAGGSYAAAQATAGAISGVVTDPSGASIAGATVNVTSQSTNSVRVVTTNDSGFYSAEGLSVGDYSVSVSKSGFETTITRGIHLNPGQRYAANVSLQISRASTTVNVTTAGAEQVNTETSESGGTLESKQISNLMLNGRSFQTLALAIPGVSSTAGADQLSGGGLTANVSLIINGSSVNLSDYTIDGMYDMNSGNYSALDVYPVVDGIAEFSVLKDNYSAKYGFAGSGQTVVATKSGSDTFHGSAWDYLRNTSLNAVNFFATSPQDLHQQIFGYSLGGPLIIPHLYNTNRTAKTYFFALNQWYSIHAGLVETASTFPSAMRAGNFSSSPTLKGNLTLDANSQALLNSEGKSNCITGPKTLNPNCFDPVAVNLMNAYMPIPNNTANGFVNYINQNSEDTTQLDYQYRIDQSINQNNLLTARIMYEPVTNAFPYDWASGNPFNTTTDNVYTRGFNGIVRLQSTISSHFLNTATVGETFTRQQVNLTKGGTMPSGTSIMQYFPNAPRLDHIPSISISSGWTGLGISYEPFGASDGEGLLADDINWVRGRHVISAGALYMFGIKRQTANTNPQGSFSFTGTHTGDPAADFLLGLDSSYSQSSSERQGALHYRQGEAYVQDDYKAMPRLTLNLGLRWVYFSSDTVSGDQVTAFSPALYDAAQAPVVNLNGTLMVNSSNQPVTSSGELANTLNGLVFAGQNGVPSGFFTPKKTLFGPRIGFAYDVFGNQKTSIRGGYGLGYSRVPLQPMYFAWSQNPPYNKSVSLTNSLLSDAVAGTAAAPTGSTMHNMPFSFTPTQVQTYSLTLEQQLRTGMIASVAYVGSQTHHLENFNGGFDLNFPLPVTTPSLSTCLAAGQVPSTSYDFDPCINKGSVSEDYTRPYKGYSTMTYVNQEGSANYNSLQAEWRYTTRALQVTAAYTFSKALATVGSRGAGGTTAQASPIQNPRDLAAEYGPPDYDFRNDISATWVYNIPALTEDHYMSLLTNGWSLTGLFLHRSGFALSPAMGTGTNGLATRPNQVAGYREVGSRKEWFDTSAFVAPGFGFFGDARNGTIRGPGYTSANVGLYRTFPIEGRLALQFRAEAFNVANHPNFENVNTSVGAGAYGQITSAGDPRIMEFALRLSF